MTKLKKIIDDDGFNKLVKGREGYFLYNENDIYVGQSIGNYGEYNKEESDTFALFLNKGDVAVEVGANIGSHTVGIAKRVLGDGGYVIAFEPQRVVFQNLCANIALNSLTNVICYPFAVGEAPGQALIPSLDYSKEGNFGAVSVGVSDRGENVPIVALDSFTNFNKLKLLKIDVEGMELEVIKGAQQTIKKHRPILYVENDRKDRSEELLTLIMGMNYRPYWHLPRLYMPDNYAENKENIFGGNITSLNLICLPKESPINIGNSTEITDPTEFPQPESHKT